jgi:hypothetical protein
MQWGHQIEYLESIREDMGIMPLGLANRPEEHELGGEIYQAFNTLSSSRSYGMSGPLPISITDMASYCQLFEVVSLDERAAFIRQIQRLDHKYLEIVAARNDTNTKGEVVNDGPALDNQAKG